MRIHPSSGERTHASSGGGVKAMKPPQVVDTKLLAYEILDDAQFLSESIFKVNANFGAIWLPACMGGSQVRAENNGSDETCSRFTPDCHIAKELAAFSPRTRHLSPQYGNMTGLY